MAGQSLFLIRIPEGELGTLNFFGDIIAKDQMVQKDFKQIKRIPDENYKELTLVFSNGVDDNTSMQNNVVLQQLCVPPAICVKPNCKISPFSEKLEKGEINSYDSNIVGNNLSDSEKYKRIKEQNLTSTKKIRMKRKQVLEESDKLDLDSNSKRRPRMNLSQFDDAAKYKRIRELNNIASKRLREKKRKYMQDISQELNVLSLTNDKLKAKLNHLQAVQGEIRNLLLERSHS